MFELETIWGKKNLEAQEIGIILKVIIRIGMDGKIYVLKFKHAKLDRLCFLFIFRYNKIRDSIF